MIARHAYAAAAAAIFIAAGWPTPAPADDVTVAIEFARPPLQVEATLRDIVADAPLAIVRRGYATVVETDMHGYQRLMAEPTLTSVRIVSAAGLPTAMHVARAAKPRSLVTWHIRLQTTPARPNATGAMDVSETASAHHAATATSLRRVIDSLPPSPAAGPGMLVVRGLDSGGNEVTRRTIKDPRLVRYEAAGTGGHLTTRRDFIRTQVEFDVLLPDDPRVTALSIASPGSDANGTPELNELVRAPAR
jgi:hypothetical protein